MAPKQFADKITFGNVSKVSQRVFIPLTDDQGKEVVCKTPKGRVVSYDDTTQVLCIEFGESSFLHQLTALNEKVFRHVDGLKRSVYGKVSEEDLQQIYRPFVIGQHAFFYAWDPQFVYKDGTKDPRTMQGIVGCEVKLSFHVRGVSLHPGIFGCALEVGSICVFKEPRVQEPEPEPEPVQEPVPQETFSDDEEESMFPGILRESNAKELPKE